jgi:hypothetical protein
MIIITNPINPFQIRNGMTDKIYQSPQKVADEYNQFRASMEKMKHLPIVYISTMGITGEDILNNVESNN